MVDWAPPKLPPHPGFARHVILEDNDAVIKLILKGRSMALRHIARVHRIDLDWLIARVRGDPGIDIKFIGTKYQIADILTEAIFTSEQCYALLSLAQVGQSFSKNTAKTNPRSTQTMQKQLDSSRVLAPAFCAFARDPPRSRKARTSLLCGKQATLLGRSSHCATNLSTMAASSGNQKVLTKEPPANLRSHCKVSRSLQI